MGKSTLNVFFVLAFTGFCVALWTAGAEMTKKALEAAVMLSLAFAGVYALVAFPVYTAQELRTIFAEELKAQTYRNREALTLLLAMGFIVGIGGGLIYVGIGAFREIARTF